MLSKFSPVLDLCGLPNGPRRVVPGSISKRLASLSWDCCREVFVPMDEFVSAPMICVVFLCERMLDRKVDSSSVKASSSFSLYPEWGKYTVVKQRL